MNLQPALKKTNSEFKDCDADMNKTNLMIIFGLKLKHEYFDYSIKFFKTSFLFLEQYSQKQSLVIRQ